MNKVKVHLHTKRFDDKPPKSIVGSISNGMTKAVASLTPKELALEVGEQGRTVVLATMGKELDKYGNKKRTSDNMEQQQVLMLDYDEGTSTIEDVLADEFVQENASFIYKTFSHTTGHERFRVTFILEEPITSKEAVESAYFWLFDKFTDTDKATKDPARMFYGGREKVIEINYNNVLDNSMLPDVIVEQKHPNSLNNDLINYRDQQEHDAIVYDHITYDTPTWILIKSGQKDMVKERLSSYIKDGHAFATSIEALRFISTLDMSKILGVEGNPFRDILSYDETPSASIWKSEKSGYYLYTQQNNHNTSTGGARTYDLEGIIKQLTGTSLLGAEQYLMDVFGISHDVSPEYTQAKHRVDKFKYVIGHENLRELFPGLYFMIGKYGYPRHITSVLNHILGQTYDSEDGFQMISWLSIRSISESLQMSKNTVSNIQNVMTLIGAFEKKSDAELTDKMHGMLTKNKTHRYNKGQWVKRTTAYRYRPSAIEISANIGDIDKMEENAMKQKEAGFSFKKLNREWVFNTHGENEADRVYPQDLGRVISKEKQELNIEMQKLAMESIEEDGYLIINELKAHLKANLDGYTERYYDQQEDLLVSGYGLKKVRLTKDLKEKFEVTHLSKHSSPSILIKE